MRIAVVSETSLGDAFASSGTPSAMAAALERHGHVVHRIGDVGNGGTTAIRVALSALSRATRRQRIRTLNKPYCTFARRALARALGDEPFDLVMAPKEAVLASVYDGAAPLLYLVDSTFHQLSGYYDRYSGISTRAHRSADAIEHAAIANADHVSYATEWAAASAHDHYGLEPTRSSVVAWGANSVMATEAPEPESFPTSPLRLLLVGKNWARKGIDVAVETTAELQRRGEDCTLTIVGAEPPPEWIAPPGVSVVSRLDPGRPDEASRLHELFATATVFLLPTRQEAQGRVFTEAASYGLPMVATDTGGVSSVVRPGETGCLVASDASVPQWADAVLELVSDRDRYRAYRKQARQLYLQEANWDTWADRISDIASSLRRRVAVS